MKLSSQLAFIFSFSTYYNQVVSLQNEVILAAGESIVVTSDGEGDTVRVKAITVDVEESEIVGDLESFMQ